MLAERIWALAAGASLVTAQIKGFNYASNGNTENSFQADFQAASSLPSSSGFNSARLYTMIQDGTTNTPSSAIPAAIANKGTLLLGLWASAGSAAFNNELAALNSSIQQYGQKFADAVVGISVGSEDLYRITDTSTIVNKDPNPGAEPSVLVNYISQVRSLIKGTVLKDKPVGHVDTYTAYINGSNQAVIDNCDFLGMDAYPYYETTLQNSIDDAYDLFFSAYDQTTGVSGGKPVWVTETGWPTSGKTYNLATASVKNAESYWKSVGCALFGKTNVWWYTLSDGNADPSFGVLGNSINNKPLFDLSCEGVVVPPRPSASSSGPASPTSSSGSQAANSGNPPPQGPESSDSSPPPPSPSDSSSPSPSDSSSLSHSPSQSDGFSSNTPTPAPSGSGTGSQTGSPSGSSTAAKASPTGAASNSVSISGASPSSSDLPSSSSSLVTILAGTGSSSVALSLTTGASNSTSSPSSSSSSSSSAAGNRIADISTGAAALLSLLGYFL